MKGKFEHTGQYTEQGKTNHARIFHTCDKCKHWSSKRNRCRNNYEDHETCDSWERGEL